MFKLKEWCSQLTSQEELVKECNDHLNSNLPQLSFFQLLPDGFGLTSFNHGSRSVLFNPKGGGALLTSALC